MNQRRSSKPAARRPAPNYQTKAPEIVDPSWLFKAMGAVLALGLVCAYVSICLLFYFQQAQLLLHPSRTLTATPASEGLPFRPVRFGEEGDQIAGQPRLSGWWIASDQPSDPTVLVLHGQDGSMSGAVPAAKALHDARLNVLLFDYSGYGESAGRHPQQAAMQADADTALAYLTSTRKIPTTSILVYGDHLGASLAVSLCAKTPLIAGVILDSADGDTATRVEADQRSHIVPIALLFHERFPLADPLRSLHTPKLLISYTTGSPPLDAQRAADPKMTVELPKIAGSQEFTNAVRRFLDTYIQHGPSLLGTTP